VGLLFVLVQSKHGNSLFWYRSETTETNCFKTNRKTVKKEKKKKPRKNPKLLVKTAKYAPYQTVLVGLLFVSVQSKHRNSLPKQMFCFG
jgi:hypothetical protein